MTRRQEMIKRLTSDLDFLIKACVEKGMCQALDIKILRNRIIERAGNIYDDVEEEKDSRSGAAEGASASGFAAELLMDILKNAKKEEESR